MSRRSKNTSKGVLVLLGVISLAAFIFAFTMPLSLGALGTDRLIEYDGEIVSVERARRLRRSFFQRRIEVKILYDGGHQETHTIKSDGDSQQLMDIAVRLHMAKQQPVVVSFLPNDHTLAEIQLASGEILLPQDQLRKSTLFTSWMMGIGGVVLLVTMGFIHLKRQMVPEDTAKT